jgi:inner membrane protein
MDVITHLALGICTTEVLLRRAPNKKVLLWGAIAQALPDIDTIPGLYLPAHQGLLIHRGFTHSLVFAIVCGFILALIIKKGIKYPGIPFLSLFAFFGFQLALHDLLDVCNSYGTGLLEPFRHQRFSINLLYIVDPLFTIGLLTAALVLLIGPKTYLPRLKWAYAALLCSAGYLGYAGFNKNVINNRVNNFLKTDQIGSSGYFTTPAPFNCMLWYIVIATDSTYYTGYSSVWDDANRPVTYERHPENYALLKPLSDKQAVADLEVFAGHYYTISRSDGALYFNILRFGQAQGWRDPDAPFVLSYPLFSEKNQALLLQSGRLAGWNGSSIKTYLKRIGGEMP